MATLLRATLARVNTNYTSRIALHRSTSCALLRRQIVSSNTTFARFSTESKANSVPWVELPENERESLMLEKLQKGLDAKDVNIIDMSGGCGTMYRVELTSAKFKGLSILKQHKLVNDLLSDEIKQMHGITIKTVAE